MAERAEASGGAVAGAAVERHAPIGATPTSADRAPTATDPHTGRRDVFDRDGRLIVRPVGLPRQRRKDLYYTLLAAPWPVVIALLATLYLAANLVFALAYLALGDA